MVMCLPCWQSNNIPDCFACFQVVLPSTMPSAIGLAVLLSVLSAGPPALAIPMATHYQAQPASEKSSTGSPVLSASPPLDTTSSTVPPLTPDWMRCANLTGEYSEGLPLAPIFQNCSVFWWSVWQTDLFCLVNLIVGWLRSVPHE